MNLIGSFDFSQGLSTGSWSVLGISFLAGVGSSFTPCIYPLIPVTVSVLGSRKAESKLRGFLLAFSYVFGIAVTYAALGMVAALTGSLFGSLSSNPWVLLGVASFIMAMALNMLDVFQINFSGLSIGSGKQHKPGLFVNFLYGLTFGLIASPCTAPPLAAILTWVGSTHNLILGPLYLFAFALGMGSVLLLVGTFTSLLGRVPRSGDWMVWIKKIMGYLLILMAGYFTFQAGMQW
jgi:thiol:disulfide interchange protein DsbD